MRLRFAKYHGLGNDFVVVAGPLMDPERARRVCDRRRGIGADGVLTILPPRSPRALVSMHIYNSDGSVAEMCGNGIRCVVAELLGSGSVLSSPARPSTPAGSAGLRSERTELIATHAGPSRAGRTEEVVIDTDAGPKRCTARLGDDGSVEWVSVEMGPARVLGEEEFRVGGERLRATRVSVGNPHAVLLDEPSAARAERVGPEIEKQVDGGVNVGLARVGPGGIDLVVWERGAGLTDACGTGACAAAVTAVSKGLAPAGRPIEVRLPGGALAVTVAEGLSGVVMRGPAVRVFEGEADV